MGGVPTLQQMLEDTHTSQRNCLSFIMEPAPPTRLRNIFTYFNSISGWSTTESDDSKTAREEKCSWKKDMPISSAEQLSYANLLLEVCFSCYLLPPQFLRLQETRKLITEFWFKKCRQHSLSYCFLHETEVVVSYVPLTLQSHFLGICLKEMVTFRRMHKSAYSSIIAN